MAMKKTSGGDSPLWQVAGKSFWTVPISGRRRWRIVMYSGKVIECLGFSCQGVFIGEGAASEVDLVGLTTGGRRPALGSLEAPVNFWMSGFCFVQFREYFLCNFSETQK
jgi:hypothetical protein